MEVSTDFGQAFAAVRRARSLLAAFLARAPAPPARGASPDGASAPAGYRQVREAIATTAAPPRDAAPAPARADPWRALDLDVSAVIGRRGVAAVLRRALAESRRTHAWLPEPAPDASLDACLDALRDARAAQPPEQGHAGAQAVLAAFRGLLASLVGASLTAQLLGDPDDGALP